MGRCKRKERNQKGIYRYNNTYPPRRRVGLLFTHKYLRLWLESAPPISREYERNLRFLQQLYPVRVHGRFVAPRITSSNRVQAVQGSREASEIGNHVSRSRVRSLF